MLTKTSENAERVTHTRTQVLSRNSLGLVNMPKIQNIELVM